MSYRNLPTDDASLGEYVDAWCDREARILGLDVNKYRNNPDQKYKVRRLMHDDLYKNLDTLDGKVAAFVQVASVSFAIFALLIQVTTNRNIGNGVSVFLVGGSIFSALSVLLSLNVIYIRWTSTGEITKSTFLSLLSMTRLRNKRTRMYIYSYWSLLISFSLLAVFAVSNFNLPSLTIFQTQAK